MTQDQKIIRAKVGLLELAKQLGNVSQACKMMGPGLVDEHQALGVKPALMRLPPGPAAGNVGAILLAGVQAFF